MVDAGRDAVAKANGYWDAAYGAGDGPLDLMDAIAARSLTQAVWDSMAKKDRYAVFVRMGSLPVSSEARGKKIISILDELQSCDRDSAGVPDNPRLKVDQTVEEEVPAVAGRRSSSRLAKKACRGL